jgi:inner membrane protein
VDLLTQGVLGGAVGQAGFYRSLGRRALGWGAVLGMAPDLDIMVRFSSNPFAEILYHRGVTHSLWFGPVIGPLAGVALWHYYKKQDSLSAWIGLAVWALVTHPLLDLFTVYGTQLLAPLSFHRFTLSAVPIIDPIYTAILTFALLIGIIFHRKVGLCVAAASLALVLTSGYLFYGLAQNERARTFAQAQLAEEGRPFADVRVYTTMFQIFLRRIVVHFPDEVWIGFLTTWMPQKIVWYKQVQAPDSVRKAILNHPSGKIYQWFTGNELIFQPCGENPALRWQMLDSRFGLAGSTVSGLWGKTVTFDQEGHIDGTFMPLKVNYDLQMSLITDLWKTAFGRSDKLLYSSFHKSGRVVS